MKYASFFHYFVLMKKEDIIKLNHYLDNTLSLSERIVLEERLQSEEDLQKQLSELKAMRAVLKATHRAKLKEHIVTQWQTVQKKNPIRSLSQKWYRRKLVRWAAVCLGFGLLTLVYLMWPTPSATTLAENYLAVPYPSPTVTKGNNTENNLYRQNMVNAYQQQDYAEVIRLSSNPSLEQLNSEQQFYTALAYLYNQPPQYEKAIEWLESLTTSENLLYGEQAQWYLALALLQNGQEKQAENRLKKIVTEKRWKYQEARQLLEKME